MSRAVVGYEPGTRRPIHADLGPARARSSDAGLARFSDIVIPGDEAAGDGSGVVEKRQATEAQRAAWAAAGGRGAPTSRTPVPPAPRHEEEPMDSATAGNRRPDLVAPCEECAHRVVCRIRTELEDSLGPSGAFGMPAGIHVVAMSVDCDHFMSAPSPVVETPAAAMARRAESRARGAAGLVKARAVQAERRQHIVVASASHHSKALQAERADRARAVLAALERHQGDTRAAALELGWSVGTVAMVASWARRKAKQA